VSAADLRAAMEQNYADELAAERTVK